MKKEIEQAWEKYEQSKIPELTEANLDRQLRKLRPVAQKPIKVQLTKKPKTRLVKENNAKQNVPKHPITHFLIEYVMDVEVDPEIGFVLSVDCLLLLLKKKNIVPSEEGECIKAMKEAAAGLGAKLWKYKVSFIETQACLQITQKQAA